MILNVKSPEPEMAIFYPLPFYKLSNNWMLDSFLYSMKEQNGILVSKTPKKKSKKKSSKGEGGREF